MIIAVASGKGGTGKTLVSTALALLVDSCTFVDFDVEEPNGALLLKPVISQEIAFGCAVPFIDDQVCTHCRACADACAYHALAVIPAMKKAMFFPELCHFCGVCAYVCPQEGALTEKIYEIGKIRMGKTGSIRFIEGRLNVGQPSAVPLIKGIFKYLADATLVIADCPPGTSCPVVESIKKSDYVILVTEPTPFGLNDLQLAAELVKDMGKPAGVIINKSGNDDDIEAFARASHLPVLLKIPYLREIQEGYAAGMVLTKMVPLIKEPLTRLLYSIIGDKP